VKKIIVLLVPISIMVIAAETSYAATGVGATESAAKEKALNWADRICKGTYKVTSVDCKNYNNGNTSWKCDIELLCKY